MAKPTLDGCPQPRNAPEDLYTCHGLCDGRRYRPKDLYWSGIQRVEATFDEDWWDWRCWQCIDNQQGMVSSGITLADHFAKCGVLGCDEDHLPMSSRCETHKTKRSEVYIGSQGAGDSQLMAYKYIGDINEPYEGAFHAKTVHPSYTKSQQIDTGSYPTYDEAVMAIMLMFTQKSKAYLNIKDAEGNAVLTEEAT